MYSKTKTTSSIETCSSELDALKQALSQADAVVVGAGSGLSTAAGYTYTGERFERLFPDFISAYGFTDMYSAGFYPYATPEEQWAFWSRYIYWNRYVPMPTDLYERLRHLVEKKDYFVLTTNVDHCFQRAGFDKKRLFYTQGDYGLWQCSVPCHAETYDNEAIVKKMVAQQADRKVPAGLIPHCPKCGAPMTMNLRSDDTFVQDAGWYAAAERYDHFVQAHQKGNVLYLELGVGYNTPGIIKYPFWQKTFSNGDALYACVNAGQTAVPKEIAGRSLCIQADLADVVRTLGQA
ncbi:Sir2 silent information regulator family NAD-dependent deacetylase [uncultured Megasphaera sp.]|uniref:SIR2 family NAD-dependent protein deacylase n=1 Tax=uncultured Megasphaera sp. TaxID=165188 RepID=UPI002596C236|nr:Sir2 silent information regulator family NAD-dependent deacetylase [uncultured Megasphaera sp.]